MSTITDITVQKKNKSRCSVFVDGEFVCGLDMLTCVKNSLKIGEDITVERLCDIQRESESLIAFDRAAGYISIRMRSEFEIRKYLKDKGYIDDVIEDVLKKLRDYKFVDDKIFAEYFVNSKRSHDGMYKIASCLRSKFRVSDSIIQEVCFESESQSEEAYALAAKYLRTHSNRSKVQTMRYLANKGFSYEVVSEAVTKANDEGLFDGGEEDLDDWVTD